ncbi:SUMF1/EgtB/PvdO family nonheme iron enzyme [Hydrogenophaga sp.]|uniref:formylglycine-generating enzyme family protein n=1 Tax=Hydrogenophaga sp. TaxID=1904254 RepID=UPI0025BAF62A|nr:SUMF1/EgtB/PvdO family nonheme iron enzyme [Hydrogenophaga sp.]
MPFPAALDRRTLPLALLTAVCGAAAQPADRVTLPDFVIDRTEVTIAQFTRFAAATGLRTRAEREGGGFEYVGGWQQRAGWTWRTPDGSPIASDQLPAVHLTHGEAQAYCQWAGGRLPTAAEWMSAAYTEQRSSPPSPWQRGKTYDYPTGDSPQGANTSAPDAWPRAAPAGATAAGVNGLLDMGANAWEWVSDARGAERRTMGGSWWYGASQMRAEVNAWKDADFAAVYIGFRCVYPNR